jgi:putative transposase
MADGTRNSVSTASNSVFHSALKKSMKITRGYKTELDLNNKQVTLCLKHAGTARYAFNWGLARKREAYKKGEKVPTAIDLHRELNTLKQSELSWMYEVSKCAPQEALRNVDRAYDNFFRKVKLKKQGKHKGKVGFPKFKSKKKGIGSFRLTGTIKVLPSAIQLPRLGMLRLKEHGYLPASGMHILSATISEQAGRWFVSVQVEEDIPEPPEPPGQPIGIDLGIKTLATLSDAKPFENSHALKHQLKKLKRVSRAHSRKHKGSKNREKSRRKLAKLHARIAHIRKDTLHKFTTHVCKNHGYVAVEDLHVAGMLKNHHLAQAISDASMGEIKRQLQYKAEKFGTRLVVIDRFYPSSKTCSSCGWINENLELSQRMFVCVECGYLADRDYNAAKNILAVSLTDSLNACGAASSGYLVTGSETSRVEAGTRSHLGVS